jgi:hypothetical protein
MTPNDHSLGAKLILYVGATAVLSYALATVQEAAFGNSDAALGWSLKLIVGLGAVVVAAALVDWHSTPH